MTNKLMYPPPPTVPFGRVSAGGQVFISNDWALYLTTGLLNRIGGYNAPSLADLQEDVDLLSSALSSLSQSVSSLASRPPSLEDPTHEETFVIVQQPADPPQQVVLMLGGDTFIEETYVLR